MMKLTTTDMTPEERRLAYILSLGMDGYMESGRDRGIPYAHYMTDYLMSRGVSVDLSVSIGRDPRAKPEL